MYKIKVDAIGIVFGLIAIEFLGLIFFIMRICLR